MMRFRETKYAEMDRNELLKYEAAIHDSDYQDADIFGSDDPQIRLDRFWKVHRRPYHRGAYIRGYRKRRLFELLDLDHLEGTTVLDVGCGAGQHAVLLAKYGARVTGIDVSSVAIRGAQKLARVNGVSNQCFFHVGSVDRLPYEEGCFDILLCNAVLHHVWKYEGSLEELYRVLASSGRLFFAEGIRSNSLYCKIRDVHRKWTGAAKVQGDVDLEFEDLIGYAERFEDHYIEYYTLTSAIKKIIAGNYGSSWIARAVLWVTEHIDNLLLRVPCLRRFALEVVGYMEKSSNSIHEPGKYPGSASNNHISGA